MRRASISLQMRWVDLTPICPAMSSVVSGLITKGQEKHPYFRTLELPPGARVRAEAGLLQRSLRRF